MSEFILVHEWLTLFSAGKTGSQVICPYRGDPYFMKDLKLAGDLGQILFLVSSYCCEWEDLF